MPEKPEVQCYADSLHQILAGQLISKVNFGEAWTNKNKLAKGYQQLKDALPLRIVKVWSKGKKIIFDFEQDYYMVNYLGMEGKWSSKPLKHSHIHVDYIQKEEQKSVWYNDTRYFGDFEFYHSQQELNERLEKIGPDLLNDNVSIEDWLQVTTSKRVAKKQVCEFLMDQQYFSGVGNYIKSEALYRAKLRPDVTLDQLSQEMLIRLLTAVKRVIVKSYEARGASLHSYFDFDGNLGGFEVAIYGYDQDAKGNTIIKSNYKDDRTTYWVPEVQILPSKWQGPEKLCFTRLQSKGKDKYAVWELRNFCMQLNIGTAGTRLVLIKKLLELQ